MWNKQRALASVAVAGLLAGVAWVVLRPHEPVFQGKPLSFWLNEAYLNGDLWDDNSKPTAEAAMRALGTNAAPILVRMAGTRFSGWRILWRMTFGASLDQMAHDPQFSFLHLPSLRPDQKQQIAFWGFKLLGPQAHSAVPALVRLLDDEDLEVRCDAAICLSQIGPAARDAVPALGPLLTGTNATSTSGSNPRQLAAFALGRIGPAARAAIPQLTAVTNDPVPQVRLAAEWALLRIKAESPSPFIERLKDTSNPTNWHATAWLVANLGSNAQPAIPLFIGELGNRDKRIQNHAIGALGTIHRQPEVCVPKRIQNHAIGALGTIHRQPEVCVPAIVPFLRSTNANLRQTAIWALRNFGAEARPALPEIVRCLKDSDAWVQRQATNALREIDPDAAGLVKTNRVTQVHR